MLRTFLIFSLFILVSCNKNSEDQLLPKGFEHLTSSSNQLYFTVNSIGETLISKGELVDHELMAIHEVDFIKDKDDCGRISCCGDIGDFEAGAHPSSRAHTLKLNSIKLPCVAGAKKYRMQLEFRNVCNPREQFRSGQFCIPGGQCQMDKDFDLPLNFNVMLSNLVAVPYFDITCDCYEFRFQVQWTKNDSIECTSAIWPENWTGCSGWSDWGRVPGHPVGTPGAVSCIKELRSLNSLEN